MSDSNEKKVVDAGSLRGMAQDHMTVFNAERALRNKTANLSSASAASRLSRVTAPVTQGSAQGPSPTPATPAAGQSNENK
jgi:hypothetical protein